MCYHIANGICSTRCRRFTKIFATVENTGLSIGAVIISTTSDLTSLIRANLSRQTFFICSASQKTSFIDTNFFCGAIFFRMTGRSTPSSITDHTGKTFVFETTSCWDSDTTSSVVIGITCKAIRTRAHTLTVFDSAQSVRATGVRLFTWVLTHQIAREVRLTDSSWRTVRVTVRAFIRTSTSGLTIGRTDILL